MNSVCAEINIATEGRVEDPPQWGKSRKNEEAFSNAEDFLPPFPARPRSQGNRGTRESGCPDPSIRAQRIPLNSAS